MPDRAFGTVIRGARGHYVSSSQAYGDYILRTGKGIVGQYELLMGEYWYNTRFKGKKPIADVGPGRCWFTKQAPSDIVAIDNSPELVRHFSAQGIDIRLGDAYHLPVEDNYFEGIFCCWLLEHIEKPDATFNEFYRALKPGGYLSIIVPTPNDMNAFYDDYTHVRPYTATSLGELASGAGFSNWRSEFFPWLRGNSRVLALFGNKAAYQYWAFGDRVLRRLGILNRNHIVLDAWK